MRKINITSQIAHFKIPYASKYQKTYDIPPISTVIGILKVLFGEEVNDFIFGYTFEYEAKYKDLMTLYKININQIMDIGSDEERKELIKDVASREYIYNCILKIYTTIDTPIKMNYCLTMGRANCLARVHFPFKEVKLIDKEGVGTNQYTPIEIGQGVVKPITYFSKYDKLTQSFETKVKHLRENKQFEYDKHYDNVEEKNIFLWRYKDGEIFGVS